MSELKTFVCLDSENCGDCLTVGKTYEGSRNKQGYVSLVKCDDGKPGTFNAKRLTSVKGNNGN